MIWRSFAICLLLVIAETPAAISTIGFAVFASACWMVPSAALQVADTLLQLDASTRHPAVFLWLLDAPLALPLVADPPPQAAVRANTRVTAMSASLLTM
jgi:hypothetical protein